MFFRAGDLLCCSVEDKHLSLTICSNKAAWQALDYFRIEALQVSEMTVPLCEFLHRLLEPR